MLEIKISVRIEGLDRLADALFAIAGASGQAGETAGTPSAEPAQQAAAPVTPPAQQAAAPVTPPVPTTPPAQQAAAVPVSATSYSMEDLAHAAMALMDGGKQAGLQALLAKFGVESLPQLPPAHYGAFATEMREMGAQI